MNCETHCSSCMDLKFRMKALSFELAMILNCQMIVRSYAFAKFKEALPNWEHASGLLNLDWYLVIKGHFERNLNQSRT